MNRLWPLLLLIAAACFYLAHVVTARAHSWYEDTGCCYGEGDKKDCDPAPDDSIREVRGGWIVTLTKDQMLRIRPGLRDQEGFQALKWGISEFVSEKVGRPSMDGGYHVCLKASPTPLSDNGALRWILCFFFPTNS
jgi:hypothetical protein